jgi:riboflavin synthase
MYNHEPKWQIENSVTKQKILCDIYNKLNAAEAALKEENSKDPRNQLKIARLEEIIVNTRRTLENNEYLQQLAASGGRNGR